MIPSTFTPGTFPTPSAASTVGRARESVQERAGRSSLRVRTEMKWIDVVCHRRRDHREKSPQVEFHLLCPVLSLGICGFAKLRAAYTRTSTISARRFLLSAFLHPPRRYCSEAINYVVNSTCLLVDVTEAGNPEKGLETVDGKVRLHFIASEA